MKEYQLIEKSQLLELIDQKKSLEGICVSVFGYANGTTHRKLMYSLREYGIDPQKIVEAFYESKRVHERSECLCPVCGKTFKNILSGKKDEKIVCSRACSNTFFRSGVNNPNWKGGHNSPYRSLCFNNHEKKCVVCDENTIVEVHHYDGNHMNNDVRNLVPLCPTHHKYWHSRHRGKIKMIVDEYVKKICIKFDLDSLSK